MQARYASKASALREAKSVTELAKRAGVTRGYVTRILRLAFLAPDITEAILDGRRRKRTAVAGAGRVIAADLRAGLHGQASEDLTERSISAVGIAGAVRLFDRRAEARAAIRQAGLGRGGVTHLGTGREKAGFAGRAIAVRSALGACWIARARLAAVLIDGKSALAVEVTEDGLTDGRWRALAGQASSGIRGVAVLTSEQALTCDLRALASTLMCDANEALERAMASKEAAAAGSPEAAEAAAAFEAALASVLDAVKKVERFGAALVRAAGPPAVPAGTERPTDYRPSFLRSLGPPNFVKSRTPSRLLAKTIQL